MTKAVLFDHQGTIANTETCEEWVEAAAADCGVILDREQTAALVNQLMTVGRIGGPFPTNIPPHLARSWAVRDLSPQAHREAYGGLAALASSHIEGLADALYERVLRSEGWRAYADAVPTLAALRAAGVAIAVVSNVAYDIRPIGNELGYGQYVDAWVLSYEVGTTKPDPAIFRHACAALNVAPRHALMVGDTTADAGAVDAGCRALILPAAMPGAVNGLSAVLDLIRAEQSRDLSTVDVVRPRAADAGSEGLLGPNGARGS